MTTSEVAQKLNKNKWYQKKDGSIITAYQIHGRTKIHPDLFDREKSLISLKGENSLLPLDSKMATVKKKNIASIIPQEISSNQMQLILANLNQNLYDPEIHITKELTTQQGNYLVCLRKESKISGDFSNIVFTKFDGYKVIYTGITGGNLRGRYKKHFEMNNAGRSTLRMSLGVLFGYKQIPRDKNPNTGKTKFDEKNEAKLSRWMKSNLIIYFLPSEDYKNIETKLIDHFNPPFNLDKNTNPINANFRKHISSLRATK